MQVPWIPGLRSRSRRWVGPSFSCTAASSWGVCRWGGDRVPNPGPPALPCHLQGGRSHPRAAGPGPGLCQSCSGYLAQEDLGPPHLLRRPAESPRPQPWPKRSHLGVAPSRWPHPAPWPPSFLGGLYDRKPTLTPAAPGQRSRGKSFKIKTLNHLFC